MSSKRNGQRGQHERERERAGHGREGERAQGLMNGR